MIRRHDDLTLTYLESVPSGRDETGLPLVIVIHGRGADADDLASLAPEIDNGFRFILPNAPVPFEPMPGYRFGFTWFDGWPPVGSSFQRSRDLLLRFIGELAERYEIPVSRMVLCGFSQGGMMSLDAGFRLDDSPAGIVVMSGAANENDLPDFAARREIAVLVVHGTHDDVIPVIAARRTRSILEAAGIEVDYDEYPAGHHLLPEEIERVAGFIRSRLH